MLYEYTSFIKPYIALFLEQQKLSVSKFCYAHYCGVLRHFDQFIAEQGYDDCNFTEKQILQWIDTIEGKNATISSYISAVRAFFKFLNGYGFHPFVPTYRRVNDVYIAYEFSDEEINLIFSIADNYVILDPNKKYIYAQYEFPMILRLLFGCGLRLEEASTLKLEDVDFKNNALTIRKTKSNEYRIVPMDTTLADILSQYCTAIGLGINSEAYIFPGIDFSEPIPSFCFRNYFNRLLKKACISLPGRKKHERGPCIHCFRHAFAHRSFKNGNREGWAVNDQIPWLSVYLGHRNLRKTERYLKFNSDMFADEIKPFETYSMELYPEVNFDD